MKNINILFYFVLLINIVLMFVGISNYITDLHGFRQTQTAITTYYFVRDGISLDYITPVLGYPWKIPFELPLYQVLVAELSKITPLDLDICGRLVSILFFYLSLVVILRFNKLIDGFPTKLTAILFLCCGTYIFWSRTFLIESLSLFLSLQFFYYLLFYFIHNKRLYFLLGAFFAILSCLTKVTTFAVSFLALGLFCLNELRTHNFRKTYLVRVSLMAFISFLCLFIQIQWNSFCDSRKEMGPISKTLTVSALRNWNIGSMEMRLNYQEWLIVFKNSGYIIPIALLFIFVVILSKSKKVDDKFIFVGFLLAGLLGPLIFFNLYKVHNYYHYENTVFLLICIAWAIHKFIGIQYQFYAVLLIVLFNFALYFHGLFNFQKINWADRAAMGFFVEKNTEENDVILIIGNDWDSQIPYYSKRKCVLIPNLEMDKLIQNTEPYLKSLNTPNIIGVVFCYGYRNEINKPYAQSVLNYLNAHHKYSNNDIDFYSQR